MSSQDVIIGVDVGGTVIKSAIVDSALSIGLRDRRPTAAALGTETVFGNIVAAISTLRNAADPNVRVVGVGVAITGIVDDVNGIAVHSENVGWQQSPLRSMLAEATGLPVGLGHDVRAGALAEARAGAGRGHRNQAFIAIGTGVSAGIIVNDQLVYGDGYAGEIGHVDAGFDEPCGCGGTGCVEAVASASAVARRYSRLTGVDVEGSKEVADRVVTGDGAAVTVWNEAVAALATAIAWTTGVVGCDLVVVGGGMASAGALLMDPLREQTAAKLNILRCPAIVPAQLGDEAGCLGAAMIGWDQVGAGQR